LNGGQRRRTDSALYMAWPPPVLTSSATNPGDS
jgi:hypothetical protein